VINLKKWQNDWRPLKQNLSRPSALLYNPVSNAKQHLSEIKQDNQTVDNSLTIDYTILPIDKTDPLSHLRPLKEMIKTPIKSTTQSVSNATPNNTLYK
jgi:hypothetical protein